MFTGSFLRLMNGIFAGYVPNAAALIVSQAFKSKSGYALGTLATGLTARTLIGPLLGGSLAQWLGMRNVFLFVGVLLLICCLMTIFMVDEQFEPVEKKSMASTKDVLRQVSHKSILLGFFMTSMIIYISAQSISPILSFYIRYLGGTDNVLFVSGLIVSAMDAVQSVFGQDGRPHRQP